MNLGNLQAAATINNQLHAICQQKKTGALVMILDGKTAFLNLENGQISYIFFKTAKGEQAIQLLRDELSRYPKRQQFLFTEGPVTSTEMVLPPTEEILKQLSDVNDKSGLAGDQNAIAHEGGINDVGPKAADDVTDNDAAHDRHDADQAPVLTINQEIAAEIRNITLDVVGPMGAVICDPVLSAENDLRSAVRAIIAELPDAETGRYFQNKVDAFFSSSVQQAA